MTKALRAPKHTASHCLGSPTTQKGSRDAIVCMQAGPHHSQDHRRGNVREQGYCRAGGTQEWTLSLGFYTIAIQKSAVLTEVEDPVL